MPLVDLNCDMGEGCGNDAALMDYVSSVNIACGVHAGDAETMRETVRSAITKHVAVGAHPSFPDRENFGRSEMRLPPNDVRDLLITQVTSLKAVCSEFGVELRHVKPHGALYNQSARDADLARVIAEAVALIDNGLLLFGLSGSHSIAAAKKVGLRTASEVFADRTYRSDGSLTPRTEPNALIEEPTAAVAQVLQMVLSQTVTANNGETVPIVADTICIHGDGKNALAFAQIIHRELSENGITIKPV